jgi:hypothetical protein
MDFFERVTMPLSEPDLIVAYSNGLKSPSAAKILWEAFGNEDPLDHVDTSSYRATYGFTATIGTRKVPVIGIRHMSRFVPSLDAIKLHGRANDRELNNAITAAFADSRPPPKGAYQDPGSSLHTLPRKCHLPV